MNTDETVGVKCDERLDMGSFICAEADEIERQRRLTWRVVEAMKRTDGKGVILN
jgi:hypothetical protein